MLNSMLRRELLVVAAVSMNSSLCCKLPFIHPFHLHNVCSPEAHSQTLFSQFASSKLNMSEDDIALIFKLRPQLQNLPTLNNAEKVFNSFKKHGFTEFQVANILRKNIELIKFAEATLESKLKLLEDFGFVGPDLAKLLTRNPFFLSNSLDNNIIRTMRFLRNVFQSQQALVKALRRSPRLLSCSLENTLKPSLAFWEGWGFSGTDLVSFLQIRPDVLTRTALIPAQVDLINKLGRGKDSQTYKIFVAAVALSRTATLEAKIENFKLCGLSDEETRQLVRTCPQVFYLSEENVRQKLNFLVNNMELPANYVLKNAMVLTLSLEKTLRPRFLVWEKIRSTSNFNPSFSRVLRMTEARFVNIIIKGHPESKTLLTIYENAVSSASKRTKSSTKT